MQSGNLFVISAPSGTGKTTLLKKVLEVVPRVAFSVSHTTRPPRSGEQEGIDYHFISREQFLTIRNQGDFLEWAEVHGNFYGTSKAAVAEQLAQGIDLILDIDVQGAGQVRAQGGWRAISLFIVPPSWDELERRLTARGTDDSDTITRRLANARRELADIEHYDYVIVNDRVEEAFDLLRAVIIAERSRGRRSASGLPLDASLDLAIGPST